MQRRGPFWKSSTGRVLEVVCDYKHVGSFVTVTGGLMREAAHRTKASQSSFCSPRRKIFENHALSTRIRLSLTHTMCVESWPCCTGGAVQKLHVQRMKWLRSIDSSEVRSRDKENDCSDDAEQSTEHKEPERDVLCRLEQNYTTVEVRARRLAYCLRLLKHAPRCLLALLQSPYQKRLVHRSWSQIFLDDIYSLIGATDSRLAELWRPATRTACLGKLHP